MTMRAKSLRILSSTRGVVSDAQADFLCQLTALCADRGIPLSRTPRDIPGLLEHARNTLCGDVLECPDPPSHWLWLDTDTTKRPMAVLEAMARPEALIASAYPQRNPNWERLAQHVSNGVRGAEGLRSMAYQFGVALQFENGRVAWSDDKALCKARHLGFGCVLIQHDPFVAFLNWLVDKPRRDAHAFVLAHRDPSLTAEETERDLRALLAGYQRTDWIDFAHRRTIGAFDFTPIDGIPVSGGEDTSFYYRWRAWGGTVWLDPWEPVTNGGRTGAYIDYLRELLSSDSLGLPAGFTPARIMRGHESATLAVE